MINLDYAADLPINTMGRRIRTRLYFTSESHLHTLLNVLRFPSTVRGAEKSPLSKRGVDIISLAPELCYLTQVVIRLFENTSKDVNEPKRFRIEILFSPGATATPLHMSELQRDADVSRFDTEPLQLISSDYLTCKAVEDYFGESIKEGHTEEEDDSASAIPSNVEEKKVDEVKESPKTVTEEKTVEVSEEVESEVAPEVVSSKPQTRTVTIAEDKNQEIEPVECSKSTEEESSEEDSAAATARNVNAEIGEDNEAKARVEKDKIDAMARILSRQFFWTSVATVSFVVGIGFLVLSREVQSDFKTRRWSKR